MSDITTRSFFVLGCQRSGTTMLVDTIGLSPLVRKFGEGDSEAMQDYRLRAPETVAEVIRSTVEPAVVFKPICDSHYGDQLLRRFDGSRAIWIWRRFQDVALSAIRVWGSLHREVMQRLRDQDWRWLGWMGERLSPELVEQVRGFWRPDLTDHEASALFWYLRNRPYFDHGLDGTDLALLVRYEDLVTEPEAGFRRVFEFVGVPFETRFIAEITARNIGKETFPPIDPRIEGLCRGLEARFAACL